MEGQWPSLSSLDRRICSLFFYWSTWTVFLGAMLVRAAHPASVDVAHCLSRHIPLRSASASLGHKHALILLPPFHDDVP